MKTEPTQALSVRSALRRVLLLGVSLMVLAGLCAPVAHALISRNIRRSHQTLDLIFG